MFKPIVPRCLSCSGVFGRWSPAVGSGFLGSGRALRVATESSLQSGIDVPLVSNHSACLH